MVPDSTIQGTRLAISAIQRSRKKSSSERVQGKLFRRDLERQETEPFLNSQISHQMTVQTLGTLFEAFFETFGRVWST